MVANQMESIIQKAQLALLIGVKISTKREEKDSAGLIKSGNTTDHLNIYFPLLSLKTKQKKNREIPFLILMPKSEPAIADGITQIVMGSDQGKDAALLFVNFHCPSIHRIRETIGVNEFIFG
jgi:hypothetical protein